MRLATYRGPDGAPRAGARRRRCRRRADRRPRRCHRRPGAGGDLLALLEAGPAALDAARAVESGGGAGVPLASVELLAPIRRPGKLLAVAGNFQAHIEEGGGSAVDKTKIVPKLFIKPSSSIIGPGEAVALPTVSNALDWELELAIVIGTARPRHPAREGARPHRRLLGHQRHLGALACSGASRVGARAGSTTSSTGSTASGATASRPGARGSRRPTRSSPTRTSSR